MQHSHGIAIIVVERSGSNVNENYIGSVKDM